MELTFFLVGFATLLILQSVTGDPRTSNNIVFKEELPPDSSSGYTPTPECPPPTNAALQLIPGLPGRDGLPGVSGSHGIPGVPGQRGQDAVCDCSGEIKKIIETNEIFHPNIQQCAWNKYNMALQRGKVQACTINKRRAHTSLKVGWYGSTRLKCSGGACCQRWYFTFNGGECTNPQKIDGLLYIDDNNATINLHRATSIVGICRGIPDGNVNVGFWIGKCEGGYKLGDSRTGWNSSSRIIIEEIPLA